MFDLLIKNGKIVDGSSSPWKYGDIAIQNGKIVEISKKINKKSKKTIDATGKFVVPGFIDLHSHSDLSILKNPKCDIKLKQGITTEIFGNCGFSVAPVKKENLELLKNYTEPIMGTLEEWKWNSFGEYLKTLEKNSFAQNVGGFVGNGSLRIAVKGFDASPMTKDEMIEVKSLLKESLEQGAKGLSLGLMYTPENYYSKEEIIEICGVLKDYDGIITAHVRGEGNSLLESIDEILSIAEQTGLPVHISHFKAAGKNNWNIMLKKGIKLIEKAREKGIDITCDVYPYNAGSTTLASLLPPWALEGGIDEMLKRITNTETKEKILNEMRKESTEWDNLVCSTGWENVMLSFLKKNKELIGKNILEIAKQRKKDPYNCALDLLLEENGKIGIIFFHMSQEDVDRVIMLESSFIISDSLFTEGGLPHPRLYGTFPRVISEYVRKRRVITLEKAIQKMTSYPAKRLSIQNRGLIHEDYFADIVIFDFDKIQDNATYLEPNQPSTGIEYVIVNGKIELENNLHNSNLNGKLI